MHTCVRRSAGTTDVVASAGPRGALGQIWRLDVGSARYALKEIFAEPPSEALVAAELAFARRAAAAGVRLPASHPDRDGRYLLAAPGGTWLRLYDWVDLRPVDLTAPATPQQLGALLARLHRCAPAATVEPGGGAARSLVRPRARRARVGRRVGLGHGVGGATRRPAEPRCPSCARRSRRPIPPG